MKQQHNPLTRGQYQAIKVGDVIERMLAFCIPMNLVVQSVTSDVIDAGWIFDRNTGLEIDEDIPATVSYISRVFTKEELGQMEKEE